MYIILIILIVILLISLIIIKYNYYYNIEHFDNTCNNFYKNKSFCEIDHDTNKCDCRYQKDGVKYNFDSPNICCKRVCSEIPLDECIDTKNDTEMHYYCQVAGKCLRYTGSILNKYTSSNNCGTDPLNNQLVIPYESEEDCMKELEPCYKYNVNNRSININKEECLKDVNCGFVKSKYGDGKCISGTAEGPLDLNKYYYASIYNREGNEYYYGSVDNIHSNPPIY